MKKIFSSIIFSLLVGSLFAQSSTTKDSLFIYDLNAEKEHVYYIVRNDGTFLAIMVHIENKFDYHLAFIVVDKPLKMIPKKSVPPGKLVSYRIFNEMFNKDPAKYSEYSSNFYIYFIISEDKDNYLVAKTVIDPPAYLRSDNPEKKISDFKRR